jgi:membrane protease subunit (stomatin/prohibitin family)
MAITRQVITSLQKDGTDLLGSKNIAVKIADESIVTGSLLTVESNHFCVLKSRGAVFNVYETGQYAITTPDKPLLGSIVQGFFGGASPWVYEVIYINRSKIRLTVSSWGTTAEMGEVNYWVYFFVHVDNKQGALNLLSHLPFNGSVIDKGELEQYCIPVITQVMEQILQTTPMDAVSEHVTEIREAIKPELAEFLHGFGIMLDEIKVQFTPRDDRMRELLSLRALGLTPIEAVRYHLALKMADKGLVSAPNAAAGLPYNIGLQPTGLLPLNEQPPQPAIPAK